MGKPIVEIKNLTKVIDGRTILKGVSLTIFEREIFVIIGGSGSGKSSLLKHIVGLWRPTSGCGCVFGVDITKLPEEELDKIRLKMGYVFQEGALFDFLKVWENVGFYYLEHTNLPKSEVRKKAIEILKKVDLDESVADLYPSQLSGGMKKRVSTARAIAGEGVLILYDEPTSGLDPITSRTIDELIVSLRNRLGVTSVVVTHDMISALNIADRIGFIYKGELVEVGTPAEEILNSKNPLVREFVQKGLYKCE